MALFREYLDIETGLLVNIALFKNVKNLPDLRSKVRSGTLKCSLLNPSLIVDPMQVVVAANKAVLKDKYSAMITRTIYSEILFNLSITRKITDSLNRFGSGNTDTATLVVVLEKSDEDNVDAVMKMINGDRIDIEKLKDYTDDALVKKTYNIKAEELVVSSLVDSVVSRIAAKDVLLLQD